MCVFQRHRVLAADEEPPLEIDLGEKSANQPGSETVLIFVLIGV